MMPRYEYQIGVYVDAIDVEKSMEIVMPLLELANNIDAEHEAAIECVGTYKDEV
jgi:hypothetical protein